MLSSLFNIGLIEVMDDHCWMYRGSPQGLRRMDYCNGVQDFINYATSNLRNISGGGVLSQRDPFTCKYQAHWKDDLSM